MACTGVHRSREGARVTGPAAAAAPGAAFVLSLSPARPPAPSLPPSLLLFPSLLLSLSLSPPLPRLALCSYVENQNCYRLPPMHTRSE